MGIEYVRINQAWERSGEEDHSPQRPQRSQRRFSLSSLCELRVLRGKFPRSRGMNRRFSDEDSTPSRDHKAVAGSNFVFGAAALACDLGTTAMKGRVRPMSMSCDREHSKKVKDDEKLNL